MNLAELNRALEAGSPCVDDKAWSTWLWGCDLHEPLSPCFNRCHLLGLLLARHKARFEPGLMDVRLGESLPNVVHPSKRACELTLRQLRDAAEDLQMHWVEHCKCGDGVVDCVEALWTRFGDLNLSTQTQTLDDLGSIDPDISGRMSNAAIRRFVVLFCVLFRHLDLESSAVQISDSMPFDLDIQNYHRQAGLDAFYEHAMYADIPPASRVVYKQDFAGMYHSITQVVYFHFPDYARKRQIGLEDIRSGKSHLHCLSVAMELRPDIPLTLEDDMWKEGWNWLLVSGGKVYLVSKDQGVFTAETIWQLLARVG